MQRQISILSFLHRPPPGSQRPGGASSHSDLLRPPPPKQEPIEIHSVAQNASAKDPFSDVRGTDTPPEKIRHPFFPIGASDSDSDSPARSFVSIMHKFARDGGSDNVSKGNQGDRGSTGFQDKPDKSFEHHVDVKLEVPSKNFSNNLVSIPNEDGNGDVFPHFDLGLDILGPETPAMRPLVPRFKRIQEGHYDSHGKQDSVPFVSNKRPKIAQDSVLGKKTNGEVLESASSKFEWLNPSSIRDKDGRWSDDPLYDKRTLYIPSDALKKMSASQKQYWSVKCQYMDVVLFFKVGKFYELYELDAEIGHKELDWKMTVSGVGKCRQVGISEAGIDDAVQKLVARGYKVGRVEQLETADQAKARGASSVIQRKLVHVSTPSTTTTTDGTMGPDAIHLLALKEGGRVAKDGCTIYGFAFIDCAALKFWVGSICDDASCAALGALLLQVSPREILYENKGLSKETHKALIKYASAGSASMQLTPANPGSDFLDASEVKKLIQSKGYFKESANVWTSAFDCTVHHDLVLCALGVLISHLCRLMLDDALRNGEVLPYHVYKSCLRMDGQTLVNLEIISNNIDGGLSGTLYKHLDHCITPSGKRLLRRWICHPMKDIDEINDRLNVVEGLVKNTGVNSVIAEYLRRIPDLERLLGRVKATVGSSSALLLPSVGVRLLKQRIKAFGLLIKGLRSGIDLLTILQKETHGILSLPKFVNLPTLSGLGELLKQFEGAMAEDFPQSQDHDVKDSDAETLSILVELFVGKASDWSHINYTLSCIDVLQSFAATAISSYGSMSRPVILPANSHQRKSSGPILHIKGLWHPYAVAESGNNLVPNDMYLGKDLSASYPCTLLLTGPNMGGKSTLLRATCLAVILAQLGSYVPCDVCVLSPADIIFTRLGATDRIMSGESTFLVECTETASVLQNATRDSLVLLDELGRGTSTFDGYAIAYAVFRHLVEKVGCRLLFATHYHPLTKEFASHPHVRLQHMACAFKPRREEKDLVFLYRLAPGACPESYGLQVALMAGIPKPVVDAASKASQRMKLMISANFKSSEERSEFSTLHEEWLKALLVVSRIREDCLDEDASDTLLCLWHEMKNFFRSGN